MMQPSQSLLSEDATEGWSATSTARRSLPQSKMRAILVIVANVFREQTFEMLLIHRNNVIQERPEASTVHLHTDIDRVNTRVPMSTGSSVFVKRGLVRAIGRWSLAGLAINSVIGSGVFGLPT